MDVDNAKLEALMGKMIGHMTGGAICYSIWLGDELGLYREMAGSGPRTADSVASKTKCNPRLVREWRDEVLRSAQTLRFYAVEGQSFSGETFPNDDPDMIVYSAREPLGVVTAITPWNFPISIPARKIAPALITETGMLPGEPDELKTRVPVGRLGHPDEVADLALAILRNPYMTNQVVLLDGGMYPR